MASPGIKDGEGHGNLLRMVSVSLKTTHPTVTIVTQSPGDLATLAVNHSAKSIFAIAVLSFASRREHDRATMGLGMALS